MVNTHFTQHSRTPPVGIGARQPQAGHATAPRREWAQLRLFAGEEPTAVPAPPHARVAIGGWVRVVMGDLAVAGWRPLILEALRLRYGRNHHTLARVLRDAEAMLRFLVAVGAIGWADVDHETVMQWCWAARRGPRGRYRQVAASTARSRQYVAKAVFEEASRLGAPIDVAALIGERIGTDPHEAISRPLEADETNLVRANADSPLIGSRRSLIVALAFAGGSATAIAAVRMCDIDPEAATVTFRHDLPRTNSLNDWSAHTVRVWLKCRPVPPQPDELVCVTAKVSAASAHQSISARLAMVVREAGLKGRPGVTPNSIRLTSGRAVLEAEGIEAAARFLGARSLDRAAAALGHVWQRGEDHA